MQMLRRISCYQRSLQYPPRRTVWTEGVWISCCFMSDLWVRSITRVPRYVGVDYLSILYFVVRLTLQCGTVLTQCACRHLFEQLEGNSFPIAQHSTAHRERHSSKFQMPQMAALLFFQIIDLLAVYQQQTIMATRKAVIFLGWVVVALVMMPIPRTKKRVYWVVEVRRTTVAGSSHLLPQRLIIPRMVVGAAVGQRVA